MREEERERGEKERELEQSREMERNLRFVCIGRNGNEGRGESIL